MKKIAISLAVTFAILSLVVSTALASTFSAESPADSIGKEVKIHLKEWASRSAYKGSVCAKGTLIRVTLEFYLVESDDLYYWIPVENIALIEVIK